MKKSQKDYSNPEPAESDLEDPDLTGTSMRRKPF
jgi:hypothetical protein